MALPPRLLMRPTISVLIRRSDPQFIRNLLRKIGSAPSAAATVNLKRIDAIGWLRRHKAFEPDRPFFMYWASGAIHGPHHVPKEWADKYKGKFDDGWDSYRERVFKRAKEMG